MADLGIHAGLGVTVRTVGLLSFRRTQGPAESPTYDIHQYDDEGEPCGYIVRYDNHGFVAYYDAGATGLDLIAIGQFVNELNEHYSKGGK